MIVPLKSRKRLGMLRNLIEDKLKTLLLCSLCVMLTVAKTRGASKPEGFGVGNESNFDCSFGGVDLEGTNEYLEVTLQDLRYSMERLHVVRVATVKGQNHALLTLAKAIYDPASPHKIVLYFTPRPTAPFKFELIAKVDGHSMFVRGSFRAVPLVIH